MPGKFVDDKDIKAGSAAEDPLSTQEPRNEVGDEGSPEQSGDDDVTFADVGEKALHSDGDLITSPDLLEGKDPPSQSDSGSSSAAKAKRRSSIQPEPRSMAVESLEEQMEQYLPRG